MTKKIANKIIELCNGSYEFIAADENGKEVHFHAEELFKNCSTLFRIFRIENYCYGKEKHSDRLYCCWGNRLADGMVLPYDKEKDIPNLIKLLCEVALMKNTYTMD